MGPFLCAAVSCDDLDPVVADVVAGVGLLPAGGPQGPVPLLAGHPQAARAGDRQQDGDHLRDEAPQGVCQSHLRRGGTGAGECGAVRSAETTTVIKDATDVSVTPQLWATQQQSVSICVQWRRVRGQSRHTTSPGGGKALATRVARPWQRVWQGPGNVCGKALVTLVARPWQCL